mgnify:CR=1 FL=1
MGKWVDKRGPIEADTIYANDKLCAQDASVTLPEVTFLTADINAMGTMSIPLMTAIDDMEMTITKVGVDKNMTILTSPGKKRVEVRWVQDKIKSDATISGEGCKAFLTVSPVTLHPGASIEIGSASENDLTYKVFRYKLVVGGKTILLVDRLAHKLVVNGKDYSKTFDSLL